MRDSVSDGQQAIHRGIPFMLRWRLLLGTLVIAALVGLCWLDANAAVPGIWLLPVVVLVTVLATQEMLELLAAAGMRPMPEVVLLTNLLLVCSPWLPSWLRFTAPVLDLYILANVSLPVFAIFIAEMVRYRQPGKSMANIAGGFLAIVYVGMMLQLAVWFRLVWGVGALATWIVVVKMGDTGAYAVGRLMGRHKMAPLISPGKTIEGALGALCFACLASWIMICCVLPRANAGAVVGLDRFRPVGRHGGHGGRFGRVAAETRRRAEGLQRLAARFRRRAGYRRFAAVVGPRGVVLLGVRAGWPLSCRRRLQSPMEASIRRAIGDLESPPTTPPAPVQWWGWP